MANAFKIILLFISALISLAVTDRCMYIDYRGKDPLELTRAKCPQSNTCKKSFKISHIHMPPYSTSRLLETALEKCCGRCANYTIINDFVNITEASLEKINSSDFIFPVLGRANAATLYGYYFVPLVNVPSGFYFTPKLHSIIMKLTINCLNLYPLLIVSLLMALVSGVIFWGIEQCYGHEEFFDRRSFICGIFDGFWFSFVSMTTVGYGDKTVKSVPAKIFAVLWILLGITMFCLLTASITTEIMAAIEPHEGSMVGSNVAALKFRDYDTSLIVAHGGIVKETKSWNFYSDVLMLVRMLRMEEIHGFLLDKYTLAYTTEYFHWKMGGNIDEIYKPGEQRAYSDDKEDIEFFFNNTYRTLKTYDNQKLSYGILIKDINDYNYFSDAIRDNLLPGESDVGSAMNQQFPREQKVDLFSASGTQFGDTLKGFAIILAFVCIIGVLYEAYLRRKKRMENCQENEELKAC